MPVTTRRRAVLLLAGALPRHPSILQAAEAGVLWEARRIFPSKVAPGPSRSQPWISNSSLT